MNETNGNNNENGHKPLRQGTRKGKGNIPIERKAEMVAALPLANGCKSQIAREFGVAESTVRAAEKDPQVRELCGVKKEEIARKLGLLVDKLTQRFLDIAEDASMDNKAAILLGIASDKHRLYLGEPTAITETRNDAALREKAEALLVALAVEYGGDRALALAALRENAPTLGRFIN